MTNGTVFEEREPGVLTGIRVSELDAIRKPAVHKSQRHLPGFFYMATMRQMVWYESRLEMHTLKRLDLEYWVTEAAPQPFLLHFEHKGKRRQHVPDYLVMRNYKRLLLNVKPRDFVAEEENAMCFSACERLCSYLGWDYSTYSEPSVEYATTINWLNGYRTPPATLAMYRDCLLDATRTRVTIGQALKGVDHEVLARPVLFHLMWMGDIDFERHDVLSDDTLVVCNKETKR